MLSLSASAATTLLNARARALTRNNHARTTGRSKRSLQPA
jgi:hypothetical protein